MKAKLPPLFFKESNLFRQWLEQHHASEQELWVGYYKKHTNKPSIDWPASVDQALCFGWIDGIRKSIDENRYMIRFTPRKPNSHWSDVNIRKMAELRAKGLVTPAGINAFEKRTEKRSGNASYEQKIIELPKIYEKQIKGNQKAWVFFTALAPSYRKMSIWWIISAKKEETRLKRLQILIDSSESGLKIPPIRKSS